MKPVVQFLGDADEALLKLLNGKRARNIAPLDNTGSVLGEKGEVSAGAGGGQFSCPENAMELSSDQAIIDASNRNRTVLQAVLQDVRSDSVTFGLWKDEGEKGNIEIGQTWRVDTRADEVKQELVQLCGCTRTPVYIRSMTVGAVVTVGRVLGGAIRGTSMRE